MPGYKAGSEDKVHMKPFLHIIDCQIRCQWCPRDIQFLYFLEGIFSFCISWNKTIDHNSRYFIIKIFYNQATNVVNMALVLYLSKYPYLV